MIRVNSLINPLTSFRRFSSFNKHIYSLNYQQGVFETPQKSMIIPVCIDKIYQKHLSVEKKQKFDHLMTSFLSFSDTLISLDSRQIKINFEDDLKIMFANKEKMKLNLN